MSTEQWSVRKNSCDPDLSWVNGWVPRVLSCAVRSQDKSSDSMSVPSFFNCCFIIFRRRKSFSTSLFRADKFGKISPKILVFLPIFRLSCTPVWEGTWTKSCLYSWRLTGRPVITVFKCDDDETWQGLSSDGASLTWGRSRAVILRSEVGMTRARSWPTFRSRDNTKSDLKRKSCDPWLANVQDHDRGPQGQTGDDTSWGLRATGLICNWKS